jgi:hypothetical protein
LKLARVVAVAIASLGVLAPALPVHAATPASGTISKGHTMVRWSGGPFYVPRPVGCLVNDPTCDRFFVRVALPAGAKIEVRLDATNPARGGLAPAFGDDYDVYVWDRNDELIAESNKPNEGEERLIFTHEARQGDTPYEIEVIPFMVAPGSTYTARAAEAAIG